MVGSRFCIMSCSSGCNTPNRAGHRGGLSSWSCSHQRPCWVGNGLQVCADNRVGSGSSLWPKPSPTIVTPVVQHSTILSVLWCGNDWATQSSWMPLLGVWAATEVSECEDPRAVGECRFFQDKPSVLRDAQSGHPMPHEGLQLSPFHHSQMRIKGKGRGVQST